MNEVFDDPRLATRNQLEDVQGIETLLEGNGIQGK
jgi:hypothetical protein